MRPSFLIFFLLVSTAGFAANSPSPEKLLKEALQKTEMGAYEEAQKIYEAVLKDNPDHERALLGLGQVYYWQGHYQAALDAYQKIIEKNPNQVEALLGISKVYLGMGNQRKAQDYLKRAEQIDPENEEMQSLSPQLEKKTKIRVYGGYSMDDPSYTNATQSEFQEISVTKEQSYGFGLKTMYLKKFGLNGFDTSLFGHYHLKEKTRFDLAVRFAPKVTILPQQGYTTGVAHTFWKITPEIHYSFQDYNQANLHFIEPAIYFDPVSFLRIGGSYEFHVLKFGATTQRFHSGAGRVKITPVEWLAVHGFYERLDRGFEGGRAPSPTFNYSANVGGGGFSFDFLSPYSIQFSAYTEDRSNGDNIAGYTFSLGFVF